MGGAWHSHLHCLFLPLADVTPCPHRNEALLTSGWAETSEEAKEAPRAEGTEGRNAPVEAEQKQVVERESRRSILLGVGRQLSGGVGRRRTLLGNEKKDPFKPDPRWEARPGPSRVEVCTA